MTCFDDNAQCLCHPARLPIGYHGNGGDEFKCGILLFVLL